MKHLQLFLLLAVFTSLTIFASADDTLKIQFADYYFNKVTILSYDDSVID